MTVTGAPAALVAEVRDLLGPAAAVTDPGITAAHAIEPTGRFRPDPVPVLRPASTAEVAEVVRAARRRGVGIVAQGGNTGLVGGASPCDGGVVVDLRGLDAVTDIDERAGQLTAGAGVTIASVQAASLEVGWAYGVDWAARGTATVGGSVATDAGGLRFVRHGGTRRQLLGVEAVLGTGQIVSHLPRVEKDNTGYDLAAVLCGSEGTLGLVTSARLRLVAPRGQVATALVAFTHGHMAVEGAALLRRSTRELEAAELITAEGLDLVCSTFGLPRPLAVEAPALLLVEVSSTSGRPEDLLTELVSGLTGVLDAAVAVDGPRRQDLWRYREAHTDAIARLGPAHKLDVTLPVTELATFIDEAPALVASVAPDAEVWCFGHAADGNVHVNVTGLDPEDENVAEVVLDAVAVRGGSISAEHGIGRAKKRWLHLARGAADVSAMRAIRSALDPDGICNPGVLFPD